MLESHTVDACRVRALSGASGTRASMSFSLPPNSTPLDPLVNETLAMLRRECEATEVEARRGILLHEIGILEDATRNDGQAARDLLTAVNTLPEFHEPLERLVAVIERRKSYKNLGKLVDRLAKIAESPEELARALVALSELREDHESDLAGSREALERATQTKGDDVDAWLSLERLAARVGDSEVRRRALAARADLAVHPEWRALLSIDVGRLHAEAGDVDAAIRSVDRALAAKSAASLGALAELERVGTSSGRTDLVLRALEERATLLERAVRGDDEAEPRGVPAELRSAGHVAEAWLRAGDIYRAQGATDRATTLLDRVRERLPDDSIAARLRLRAAEAAGDAATAAALAQSELGRDTRGPVAAGLWMRVAEAAASNGEATTALDALAKALSEDPKSLPARTLELDLLGGSGLHAALSSALESAAENLESPALAAQLFLLAADSAARGAQDPSAAKASLSQAAAAGAPLEIVARTGRMLAALSRDATWVDEATRRLLATNPPDAERASLWFETIRSKLLRDDVGAAIDAATSLSSVPGAAWLAAALHAYATSARKNTESKVVRGAPALAALAALTEESSLAAGFRLAAALRYQTGGQLDEAIAVLGELHRSDPSHLVAAVALAALHRRQDRPLQAADVLETTSTKLDDRAVAAALELEAGILRWLAGSREGAIAAFETATSNSPSAGSSLLAWSLRAAHPNDVDARRKALKTTLTNEDPGAMAVERFALEVGAGGERHAAVAAVSNAESGGSIGFALDLIRALFDGGQPGERAAARAAIARRGDAAAAIAHAAAHLENVTNRDLDARSREAGAADWATVDHSLGAALEWLAHSMAAGDVEREISARECVAMRLGEPLGSTVLASARIVGRLAHDNLASPLLPGKDPATLLSNLELAPPSCDPRRRAAVLIDAAAALDAGSSGATLALAGWNLLAAGDAARAIRAFRSYVTIHDADIVGWEGLRAAAELAVDKPLLAEASAALGDLVSDPGQGAELWERAATLLLDELNDPMRGEAALGRSIERDIGRHSAFDRLFRIVRARRDGPRLIDLVSARLAVAEDPAEIAKLYWERARALREAGDSDGALEALENVAMLEPDHVGALALTGEIYITTKRFAEAAESLARLSGLAAAPAQQRLMSGVAAVDLYENRLGQLDRALEVLVKMHASGLATMPVRERLARAAAKAESWENAATALEELMEQREGSEGRVEAARLAMAVHRDRIGDPARAERAVARLLDEAPGDGEALDLVLSGVFPKPITRRLLERGRTATVDALIDAPLDLERVLRLSEIAKQLDDIQLRQAALGAAVALGGQTQEMLEELRVLDGRIARVPQIAIDDRVVGSLRDAEDRGPIPELFRMLASTLAEALGPGLAALGVGKKERIRPQDGLPLRNEIAAWTGALGLGEFDLYLGGRDSDGICAIPTEVPAIVVGAGVSHPLDAAHRATLARELLGLKLGTTILRHRDPTDIAALVTAACSVSGVNLDAPAYAMLGEFERQLSKEIPRRLRKPLQDLANSIAASGDDPIAWVRAARSSLDRMAAVAIGDVSWVLVGGERGVAPRTSEDKLRAGRALSFVVSQAFFSVRDKLGMGVR